MFMKCDIKVIHRIKRLTGQMNGIITMMEKEASCEDLLTQLKAVRSSIDRTISLLATTNLIESIEQRNQIKVDHVEDAIQLVMKHL